MVKISVRIALVLSTLLFFLSLTGCKVHRVHNFNRPAVEIPSEFLVGEGGNGKISEWWKEFNEPELNYVVSQALENNLDVKQAWSRLHQARASACIVSSDFIPNLDLTTSAAYTSEVKRLSSTDTSFATYLVAPTLSYEVDLWRRIDSRVQAADLNYYATYEDLEATALFLTGSVVNLWFTIYEQKALLELIHHQIEVSETLLELVELRFMVGESSALSVFQQRLQLEETRLTLIPVHAALKNAQHQLNVLMGLPPEEQLVSDYSIVEIQMPEFPYMGTPADLIARRPDLRAAHYKVKSADYEVAAAVADMYPKLTLPTAYDLSTQDLGQIFQQEIFKITARFVTPIIDGGRRRCEVNRRQAIVKERLDNFGQKFLIALREVEDAIVNESASIELLQQLEKQITIAQLNLNEARQRYAAGLDDYLTVISAIQSLQRLERRMILEHRNMLTSRANLYRALGGPCLIRCSDRDCKIECNE
ncbi:MAG: TolC family protein [Chlamydiota bacterium]|nr:TolC family protein [Chlamydiota bacterium]